MGKKARPAEMIEFVADGKNVNVKIPVKFMDACCRMAKQGTAPEKLLLELLKPVFKGFYGATA